MKSIKLFSFFSKKLDLASKQLENLLDLDTENPPNNFDFSSSTDLSNLDEISLSLPNDKATKIKLLFSKISPYFEAGILWDFQNQEPLIGFNKNTPFKINKANFDLSIKFPNLNLIEIRKCNDPKFISELIKRNQFTEGKSQVLFFKPHPDYVFILVSNLSDLWLKPHIEKIQNKILLTLNDDV